MDARGDVRVRTDSRSPLSVTRALLERRWGKLQAAMAASDIDALVLAGRGVLTCYGLVAYATAYTPLIRTAYALLGREGEPTVWLASDVDAEAAAERSGLADIRMTGEMHAAPGARPTAALVAAEIRARGATRIGVAGLADIIPRSEAALLEEGLHGVSVTDATALVKNVKQTKDADEVAGLRSALTLATETYDAAPAMLQPGAPAQGVVAELELMLRADGATELLVFVHAGLHIVKRVTDTVLSEGDLVTVCVEVADRYGYWVEIAGLFSLGEPSEPALNLTAGCYEALRLAGERLRDGQPVAAATIALDEVAERRNLTTQLGLGHGIGIDHDLPILHSESDAAFEAGQVISVHPSLSDAERGIGALVADAFHVTPTGAQRLSTLPLELTVVRSDG